MHLLARALPVVLAAGLAYAAGPDRPAAEGAVFDRVVRGDVVAAAAAVTACPDGPGSRCDTDGALARWTGAAGDASTYNASAARVAIPDAASVTYAHLVWAGTAQAAPPPTRRPAPRAKDAHGPRGNDGSGPDAPSPAPGPPLLDGTCEADGRAPPGSPDSSPVRLQVGGRAVDVAPDRYERPGEWVRWYRASADVTGAFAGVRGPVTATVGNVWTPEGFGCFGGWALFVVWEDAATAKGAAPSRRVVVRDAASVVPPPAAFELAPDDLTVAGGEVAVTLAAFEGDAAGRDSGPSVNGRPYAPFAAAAEARRLVAGPDVVAPGSGSVRLAADGAGDTVLLGGFALSVPLPLLEVTTVVEPAQLMAGRSYEQDARVRNTGGVPLEKVRVSFGPGPECVHDLPDLPPGAGAGAGCTRVAVAGQAAATATAEALAPDGRTVSAGDAAGLRVLEAPPAAARLATSPPVQVGSARPQPAPRALKEAFEPVVVPRAAPPARPAAPRASETPSPKPSPKSEPVPAEIVVVASGPLDSPATTAAVIAVLGVFVMTVSVGAFGAALKPRPR